jgi:hypothetical protein
MINGHIASELSKHNPSIEKICGRYADEPIIVADLPRSNWRIRMIFPDGSTQVITYSPTREHCYQILDGITARYGLTTRVDEWQPWMVKYLDEHGWDLLED